MDKLRMAHASRLPDVVVVVVSAANRPVDHNLQFAEAAPLPHPPFPPHSRTRISGAFADAGEAEAVVVRLHRRLDSRAERRK